MNATDFFIYAKNSTMLTLMLCIMALLLFITSSLLMFISEIFSPSPKNFTFDQYLANFKTIYFYVTVCFVMLNVVLFCIQ